MAAWLGLGEPIHLWPPARTKAGNPSTLSDAPGKTRLAIFRRAARRYTLVIGYGIVACAGMIAWAYFLALSLLRAVEWALG
jgi:hypothetical protein